ncbi:MAG TPA: hypothetical protein VIY28_15950 [Pseudonocardiaceae bacterium]
MSQTQVVIVLVVGASVFILFCCLILIVILRLRRVVTSQLETLDSQLSTLQTGAGPDTPSQRPDEQ